MPVLGPLWENTGGTRNKNPAQAQPPTGNSGGAYAPPENYGQFGSFEYATDFNASGVDFRISNPGRTPFGVTKVF